MVEIGDQLGDLMADQVHKDANGDPLAMFFALDGVVRSIVKDMGSPMNIGEFARFLRDHPDGFPMFSTMPDSVPSIEPLRRCQATLQRFICEKREGGTYRFRNLWSFHEHLHARGFSGNWSRESCRPYRGLGSGAPGEAAASGAALVL
jgi:hypothetical protein